MLDFDKYATVEQLLKFLYLILALLCFAHFFRWIDTSLLLIKVESVNNLPKIVNIILVLVLPVYWDRKVRIEIKNRKGIETNHSMDFPDEIYMDDV